MEKEIVKDLCENFFSKLQISYSDLDIEEKWENSFYIKIKTEDSWIIIWPQWKNLEAIKMILRMMISTKLDKNVSIQLEINDYLETKESKLFKFIDGKVAFALKIKKDIKLPWLSWYERKLVHSYISELPNKSIYTKSMWEGKERCLYICIKDAKVTIDIDGDDI